MRKSIWLYPLAIYLIGFFVVAVYAIRFDFTTVSDTAREYWLYSRYTATGHWEDIKGIYSLQNSCLSTTLFPALLQRLIGIEPLLFFKCYICFLLPWLPVISYFIARQFLSKPFAFLTATFIILQVSFIHGPSMARSIIALIFYGLVILIIFRVGLPKLARYSLITIGCTGMVVSHYTTTYIALGTLVLVLIASGILWLVRQQKMRYQLGLLVACCALFIGVGAVHIGLTKYPLEQALVVIGWVPSSQVIVYLPNSEPVIQSVTSLSGRDKIIQAALGIQNPDGDTKFSFNWGTLLSNWLVVGIMSYGLLMTIRKRYLVGVEYLILSLVSYLMILATVAVPVLSRFYGIERVYYQALVVLAVYFVIGVRDIAKRLRVQSIPAILVVLEPYGYFLYAGGMIHSILGRGECGW